MQNEFESLLKDIDRDLEKIKDISSVMRSKLTEGEEKYNSWKDKYNWRDACVEENCLCTCCKKPMQYTNKTNDNHPTIDHILPKCYYPERAISIDNLQILCWKCNRTKGKSIVKGMEVLQKRTKQKINRLCKQKNYKLT